MKHGAWWLLALVLVFGLLLAWSGEARAEEWAPVPGPYGGSVSALVMSPVYPTDHTIFAGLRSQGVYRTLNGGNTWQRVSPNGWVVVALAISPDYGHDRTLFAAAGVWPTGYDVYRSTDEGESWTDITPAWTSLPLPPRLAVSPDFAADRALYVVGGTQTFVSTDGGDTFAPPGGWFSTHSVTALAFSPAYAADQTLFALAGGEGLFKSADGGASWSPAGPGVDLTTFAVSPDYAADQALFAIGLGSGQLYVSNDGGASWATGALTLNPGGQHSLYLAPTFGPGDRVILAASSADPGPYRSEDGGATWTPVGWYDPDQAWQGGIVGGSVYALTLAPAGSWDTSALAGTSSGIYHSYDRGVHWWRHDRGPARLTVSAVAAAPGDPDIILAGTRFFEQVRFDSGALYELEGSLHRSIDGGQSWDDVSGRLERVQDVVFSPAFADDGTAFAATGALGQHGYADGGVYRSTDGGQNWEEVVENRICHALAVSPAYAADRTVWVSEFTYSSALGLFASTDGGTTWSSLAPAVHATTLAPSPNYAVDRTLFAGTQDAGLQRSTDAGAHWTQVLTQPVTALAVSPAFGASRTLYAAVTPDSPEPGKLYRSVDGGSTWQRVAADIPADVGGELLTIADLAFAHDGTVLAGIYYGFEQTGGAVYRSADGGATWQPAGSGLDGTSVLAVATAPGEQMALYAGATGGLWRLDVEQGGPAEPGTWQGNGPRGGRALALAVSPDFQSDGVALTGEWIQHRGGGQSGLGIYRSDDQGQTWQPSAAGTEAVAYSSAVHGFGFSPDFASDGIVFAATWGGLFRSTDGGHTWPWVGRLYSGPFGSINAVALAPDFPTSGHVMASGGWGGLYISHDAGIHWTATYSVPVSGPVAYSPDFAADATAYAGGWDGLYRTPDGGASWTRVLTASLVSLAVSPGLSSDGTILAGGGTVYVSEDRGTSWISVTLPLSPTLIPALAVSPEFVTDRTAWAGTNKGLYESHDGGLSWAPAPGFPALAVHALAVSPGWPAHGVLLAGTDRGVYRTDDGGATWALAEELSTLSANALALAPDDSLLVAGVQRHGLYGSGDGGASWSALGLQSMVYYRPYAVAISPDYAADHTLFAAFVSQESIGAMVYRSRDGGATWQYVYGTGYIPDLAVSPGYATDRVVLATTGSQVVRSQDGGDTWAAAGTWPPGVWTPALVVGALPDGTLLAGGDGFWRLPPGQTVWQPAATGLLTDTRISSLAVSPGYDANHKLLAVASWTEQPSGVTRSAVWRSDDGGLNWQQASTGLPDTGLRRVAFDTRRGTAYALSQRDLYRSPDGGLSWTLVGRPPIDSDLADVVAGRDGSVYVAAENAYLVAGEGVWRYTTPAHDRIVNGGWEAGSGWEFPVTAWPAGYTDRLAYNRLRAARIGVDNGLNGGTAYSSARQVVLIPADTLTATLTAWVYPVSGEATLLSRAQAFPEGRVAADPAPLQAAGDAQYLLLLDPQSGAILDTLFWQLSNDQRWQHHSFDLSGYRGRSIKLHFGVLNDAAGGRTAMYVDDVSLVVYRAGPGEQRSYLPLVIKGGD